MPAERVYGGGRKIWALALGVVRACLCSVLSKHTGQREVVLCTVRPLWTGLTLFRSMPPSVLPLRQRQCILQIGHLERYSSCMTELGVVFSTVATGNMRRRWSSRRPVPPPWKSPAVREDACGSYQSTKRLVLWVASAFASYGTAALRCVGGAMPGMRPAAQVCMGSIPCRLQDRPGRSASAACTAQFGYLRLVPEVFASAVICLRNCTYNNFALSLLCNGVFRTWIGRRSRSLKMWRSSNAAASG